MKNCPQNFGILRALSSLVTLDHIAAADPQKGPPRNQFSVSKHPRSFLYFLKEKKRTGREEMSLYKSRGNKAIKLRKKEIPSQQPEETGHDSLMCFV